MEGTTWYVGLAGLPNQIYSTTADTVQPGVTQTVYRLDSCRYGYFHGLCRVQMPGAPSMCQNLIGCVTPEGDVQLTFLAIDDDGNVQQRIDARGVMRRHQGEWVMENQMTAQGRDDPTTFVTHWAYMLQTKPGDASWNDLPMVHVSVPKFMSDCQMGDR